MIQYLNILLNARLTKMEERGATAVEYGLLVALIAAAIVAVVFTLGDTIKGAFTDVNSSID
ncbi:MULTISPECIES: Flp family type IVb pilin [Nocardioides]|uniref:Flp family type IVb pilin n=1 Tax=Nocardioides vastitatis TaxID=2568655 RepID=A0ABW0ZC11_9ACTN|nr:Flp family type IVb pilin [Nocardioides sp.]THJ12595.1 Flp family type IVb pilin [Nocardioides sp.]